MKVQKTLTIKLTIDSDYFTGEEDLEDFMQGVMSDTQADTNAMDGVEVLSIEHN